MGVDLSRGPTAQCQMMDKKCWWYDFLPWHFFSWISGETKKNLLHPHFTGEHICRSVVWIKLQRNFIEITLWHGYSPVNSLHFFRTTFLKNNPGWLLLILIFTASHLHHFSGNSVYLKLEFTVYDCSLVAKLNWKKFFFEKIYVFYKIYVIYLYGKKKFYIENSFYWKKNFLQRKI